MLRFLSEMKGEQRTAENIAAHLQQDAESVKADLDALVRYGLAGFAQAFFVEGMGEPLPGEYSISDKGRSALKG